jgi:hypothetical protein
MKAKRERGVTVLPDPSPPRAAAAESVESLRKRLDVEAAENRTLLIELARVREEGAAARGELARYREAGLEDEQRVTPQWASLGHLVEGMRKRGHTEEACDYLASCLGLAFAKGWNARDRDLVKRAKELAHCSKERHDAFQTLEALRATTGYMR